MAVLSDILALLDRWDEWKKIKAAPARIDALEQRLAALEATTPKQAGKSCPACGEPAVRRVSIKPHPDFGDMGAVNEVWNCTACGDIETKMVIPK